MTAVKFPVLSSVIFLNPVLLWLAYIPMHYQSIGRNVTKTHTKNCFGVPFRLESCLSVVTMKGPNQSNLDHNERTDCWSNQSQLRYSIIRIPQKYVPPRKSVPCNWGLENLRDVCSNSRCVCTSLQNTTADYCSDCVTIAFRTYA